MSNVINIKRFFAILAMTICFSFGAFGLSLEEGIVVGALLMIIETFFPAKPTFMEKFNSVIRQVKKDPEAMKAANDLRQQIKSLAEDLKAKS
ncbi:hypothetical protein KAR91_01175 [Candidatus Pacearchaeota archaeon]|nr:hypothetical protein [Candidatus Pacearchaeota archaeon]